MKLTQLAARDQEATNRLVAAAEKLAELYGLDPVVLERVKTQRGEPPVRMMLQREAVAGLAEALVDVTRDQQAKIKTLIQMNDDQETEIKDLKQTIEQMATGLSDYPPENESERETEEKPSKSKTRRAQKGSESA